MLNKVLGLCWVLFVALGAHASETYQVPSAPLAALVDAPFTPTLSLGPDRSVALVLQRADRPSVAELAEPEIRLAGLRIDPRRFSVAREPFITQLRLMNVADGSERAVTGLPEGARLRWPLWSPDGRRIALTVQREGPGELWIIDVASARAAQVLGARLNATRGNPLDWMGNDALVALLIPAGLGEAPRAPTTALGPVVQESDGRRAAARTYSDMLASPHDEAVFEHFTRAEMVRVTLGGQVQSLNQTGILSVQVSPDAQHLLVTAVRKPYSYSLPISRFATQVQVLDASGRVLRTLLNRGVVDNLPIRAGSTLSGPRQVGWRADTASTLSWVQALDAGNADRNAEWRDEVLLLAAPFQGEPTRLLRTAYRVQAIRWGDDRTALVTESWPRTRQTRTWRVAPAQPDSAAQLLDERSSEDRYNDPGSPVMRRDTRGRTLLDLGPDGNTLWLEGQGASPAGNRPFLDRMDLATRSKLRVWQSQAPQLEAFVAFANEARDTLLTRRESVTEPPNFGLRRVGQTSWQALTRFAHPHPQFNEVRKELIHYARADGVKLSGTLYLPPGWTPDKGTLPTLLWAYPREFQSVDAAGQVRDSPFRFVRVSPTSALPYLLEGFAVLDDPSMPIVGAGSTAPNDTHIKQLVASAQAAIDELVSRGVTDPDRVAVGGHSYGAFMTANLLTHTRLFRAGIARSGAYNRTLTPFGFQSEDRSFWQRPDVYAAMSPFNHADRVRDAMLLTHGQLDDNSGTFPMQSERYYQALKGLGATVRYVQLPFESHNYQARESVLHTVWETSRWLDTHVKQAKPRAQAAAPAATERP